MVGEKIFAGAILAGAGMTAGYFAGEARNSMASDEVIAVQEDYQDQIDRLRTLGGVSTCESTVIATVWATSGNEATYSAREMSGTLNEVCGENGGRNSESLAAAATEQMKLTDKARDTADSALDRAEYTNGEKRLYAVLGGVTTALAIGGVRLAKEGGRWFRNELFGNNSITRAQESHRYKD